MLKTILLYSTFIIILCSVLSFVIIGAHENHKQMYKVSYAK